MAVCLITGCSSGLGEAIALAFAARGDTVVATLRAPQHAPASLRNKENIECIQLNVTDAASRKAAIDQVMDRHGRIDILVNNAGISATASIEDTPEELSRRIFETNYFAPVALMQAVLPIMRAQGGGRIVNVTAIGALLSTPLLGVYCASKHALDCAAAVVDIEGRPFGVRAPAVLPGQFKTPIMGKEPPIVSAQYLGISEALQAARAARSADLLDDLSPVADAVVAAATDPEPKARYIAGVGQLTDSIRAAAAEQERLHEFSARRSGLA